MPLSSQNRPEWLTFDCYGTLIQWDEGLQSTAARVLAAKRSSADPHEIVEPYDQHESELERTHPSNASGTLLRQRSASCLASWA